MPGGLMQLVTRGAQDIYLTGMSNDMCVKLLIKTTQHIIQMNGLQSVNVSKEFILDQIKQNDGCGVMKKEGICSLIMIMIKPLNGHTM